MSKTDRELIAHKVLSFDELMQRRQDGVVLVSGDGYTLDLALLALQDAQSKLDQVRLAIENGCAIDTIGRIVGKKWIVESNPGGPADPRTAA